MAKKSGPGKKKYTEAFRRRAVESMKESNNIKGLARELGVDRRLLYEWRERAELSGVPTPQRVRKLQVENNQLKRLLAEKTLEIDFFKGALQKVAARQKASSAHGKQASTTKSGK